MTNADTADTVERNIECKSDIGRVVGLVDALIAISNQVNVMLPNPEVAFESEKAKWRPLANAIRDLFYNSPFKKIVNFADNEAMLIIQRAADRISPAPEPAKAEAGADWHDGNRSLPLGREDLGRMVREAWVRWARTQPNPKPSWLLPYDCLDESDKEADRQIGECVARWTLIHDAAQQSLAAPPPPAAGVGTEVTEESWRTLALKYDAERMRLRELVSAHANTIRRLTPEVDLAEVLDELHRYSLDLPGYAGSPTCERVTAALSAAGAK